MRHDGGTLQIAEPRRRYAALGISAVAAGVVAVAGLLIANALSGDLDSRIAGVIAINFGLWVPVAFVMGATAGNLVALVPNFSARVRFWIPFLAGLAFAVFIFWLLARIGFLPGS